MEGHGLPPRSRDPLYVIGIVLKALITSVMVAYVAFLAWESRSAAASLSWGEKLVLCWMVFTLFESYRMGVLERKVDVLLERSQAQPKS
jgi:hypothetical protein